MRVMPKILDPAPVARDGFGFDLGLHFLGLCLDIDIHDCWVFVLFSPCFALGHFYYMISSIFSFAFGSFLYAFMVDLQTSESTKTMEMVSLKPLST